MIKNFWKQFFVWNTLNCAIRPDALFNGVSFVVLQIRVQFLQLEESLFPGGLCPRRVQGRRDHGAFGYRVGNTLHLPGGTESRGKKGVEKMHLQSEFSKTLHYCH